MAEDLKPSIPKSIYPRICENCGKECGNKQMFYSHKKRCAPIIHNIESNPASPVSNVNTKSNESLKNSIYPRQCDLCLKWFKNKCTFYKHSKKSLCAKSKSSIIGNSLSIVNKSSDHESYSYRATKKKFSQECLRCHMSYQKKTTYVQHRRFCHIYAKKLRIPCIHSACTAKFYRFSDMMLHLSRKHQYKNDIEFLKFDNKEKFIKWKDSVQLDEYVYAVNKRSNNYNSTRYIYYICQFDCARFYKKTPYCRKVKTRNIPRMYCPSRMLVKIDEKGGYSVRFFRSHVHENKFELVKYHRIPQTTMKSIKASVSLGIEPRIILKSLQEGQGESEEYEGKERHTHFIKLRTIRDIKYQLKSLENFHPLDAVSVSEWVKKNDQHVLVYKPQGKETLIGNKNLDLCRSQENLFALGVQRNRQLTQFKNGGSRIICVDDTFSTNQYGFYLYNFIAADKYGKGYPVAHFIVNSKEQEVLSALFSNFTDDLIPHVKYIMTDDDHALYNALTSTFTEANHYLCKWHILRAWKTNLNSKVKQHTLQDEMYSLLDQILNEPNVDTFKKLQNDFIRHYETKEDTASFIEYYKTFYEPRCEKWALSFRKKGFITHTNMYVESFHNQLKSNHFLRRPNRRLDTLLKALFEIEKICYLEHLFKELTNELTIYDENREKVTKKHTRGLKIPDHNVIKVNDLQWKISSQSSSETTYLIDFKNLVCPIREHCLESCDMCGNLCPHLYTCSCADPSPLCKHIHKIHTLLATLQHQPEIIQNTAQEPKIKHHAAISIENRYQETLKILDEISKDEDFSESIGNIALQQMYINIKHAVNIYEAKCSYKEFFDSGTCTFPSSQHISPNSKIVPQSDLQLYRTVKSRKKLKMPRVIDNKIPLPTYSTNSFTIPLSGSENLRETQYEIGDGKTTRILIDIVGLKSLDPFIPQHEVDMIKKQGILAFHRGWLYDDIIDAYFYILTASHEDVMALDSYSSQKLLHQQLTKLDFLTNGISRLFVPCNPRGNHWILIVLEIPAKKILIFDSLHKPPYSYKNYLIDLQNFLQHNCTDNSPWKTFSCFGEHIMQKDGFNCGVYVCWFAKQILSGGILDTAFDESDFRKEIFDTLTKSPVDDEDE